MAGGRGTRFWPLSRAAHPKQFLPIVGDTPMIQQTCDRVASLIHPRNCYVLTGEDYLKPVRKCLPRIPVENILLEPVGRNTAPAIAWVSAMIRRKDPEGIIAVLASDHVIETREEFQSQLAAAATVAADRGDIVTIGIPPDRPETGYGYLEMGDAVGTVNEYQYFAVNRFVEKPDLPRAEEYLAAGNYLWNSGMFIFQAQRIMSEFEQLQPDIYELAEAIVDAHNSPETIRRIFPQMPGISIDYAIMEKCTGIVGIPAKFSWTDIGSWEALAEYLPGQEDENRILGDHLLHKCTGSLAYGRNRTIVGVGLEDIVIVETDDAILVCRRHQAQDVGEIVKILGKNEKFSKLI